MPQDQQSIVIDEFRGLYDRGELKDINVIQIEPGFFKTLDNFYHQGGSLISRPGFDLEVDVAAGAIKKMRLWPYKRPSDGTLAFMALGSGRQVIDLYGSVEIVVYTMAVGSEDFQFYFLKDKAFGGEIQVSSVPQFTLLGNGNTKIYKLDSNPASFRDAAGQSPSAAGAMVAATSVTAGNVPAGVHLIAVVYETDSGFITPPGPFVATVYTPTQYTAPGAFSIDLSNIPLGPAPQTIKRHILASKVIRPPFDGNVLVPELFFVPGGTINDNVTTARNTAGIGAGNGPINFYDTSLVDSADYLLDELETIPAGTCYCIYSNRLIIVGFEAAQAPGTTELNTAASYVARVSNPGSYESFSATEGWIQVALDDAGPLQACWEQNGNLYFTKTDRTYVTRDNGGPPNTWPITLVDASIGCGPFGVAKIDESQNCLIEGGAIIGSHRGIYFFTGQYSTDPLTYNIDAMYRRNIGALQGRATPARSKYYYDSYRRLLYWLPGPERPFIGPNTGSTYMLVGACDNGLDPQAIRWNRFNAFNSNDGTNPNRKIMDIYTVNQFRSGSYLDYMLYMIFDDGSTAVDTASANNIDIFKLRSFNSLDAQAAALPFIPGISNWSGGIITWHLVAYPANTPELDKLQATVVRVLAKHNNSQDPVDFELGAFDYTYNEFTMAEPQFFGDQGLPDLVLIPQLYDAPVNVRSKLIGIAMNRGIRGGNIDVALLVSALPTHDIDNSVYIHKLVIFGNRVTEEKLRGSIR